jgi:hypothetical protein
VYNDEVCAIQNYKTGFKEPEPVAVNGQMKSEALIVAVNLQRAGITPKRFVVQLVTGPWGVMEAEFSFTELAQMYEEITGTLLELENPVARLNPSPEACSFCPAILICSAVQTLSVRIKPIDTDPDALCRNLDKFKIIKKQMEEFEAFCERGMTADPPTLAITDYAMVLGAEKRDWKKDKLELAQAKLYELGIALNGIKTHTVAAYEKFYAKHYGKKVEDIKEAFKQLMEGLIEYSNNKPSLKRVKEIA